MQTRLLRDYETRSEVSVVDVGPRRYASDPSTEILAVGWRLKDASGWSLPKVAILCGGSEGRAAVERRVREAGGTTATLDEYRADFARADIIVAHNVAFERAIEDYLLPDVAAMRAAKWETCTASRSRRLGLPGSLEDACKVLRTPNQKSSDGHAQMLQCSQPRPAWSARGVGGKWFEDAERLARVAIYCLRDILAECDLDDYLPELSPTERIYWLHTEAMNLRGMPLDGPLIDAMSAAAAIEQETTLARVEAATGTKDFALTNPAMILTFLKKRGVWLDDLRKETVDATLRAHDDGTRVIDEAARIVLEARRAVGGKSSVSKLKRMRERLMDDGRTRDLAIYHGAHTGRTTGDGINLLNLPRPYKKFDQDIVVDCLMRRDYDGLRRAQGVSISTAVSAALRGVIVPGAGRKLVVGDYSSVEPCFYFTLARQWDAVDILRRRESLYVEMASGVYQRAIEKERDKVEYSVGKALILGKGYGMGRPRFAEFLRGSEITLAEDMIDAANDAYLRRFPKMKDTWNGLETAAKSAIRNPGEIYLFNWVQFVSDGYWLVIILPNGRPVHYPNARLQPGKYSDEIIYEGWVRIDNRPAGWGDVRTWGGSILENVTQSACRDIMEEDQQFVEALPGWEMLLTVYDELVAAAPIECADAAEQMRAIMERPRPWMPAMPVLAEVHEMARYAKK